MIRGKRIIFRMVEVIIVFGSIGAIYLGLEIIDSFDLEYGETPYDIFLTVLTGIFLFLAIMAGLGDAETIWVVIWLILAALFYYLSFNSTIKSLNSIQPSKRDRVYALIGQFILPLGTALLIILILGLLFGGGKKGRHRR